MVQWPIGLFVLMVCAAAVVSGVRIRAFSGVLCLGVLLTFVTLALGYGWQLAAGAGILSAAR